MMQDKQSHQQRDIKKYWINKDKKKIKIYQ